MRYDEDLDEYELEARDRLSPLLGHLRIVDRRGGPPGLHDFEADLPDGSVAAVEVTSQVDAQRLSLAASAKRHLSGLTVTTSRSLWLVRLADTAHARTMESDLVVLLSDMEAAGRDRVHDIENYGDPFAARLSALGVESVSAVKPKAGSEGMVLVGAGTYGGGGWDGPAIDRWLHDLLASDVGANKLAKLGRAHATQRHLALVLDSFSHAGMGITLGLTARRERAAAAYAIPSMVPPKPLTHFWVLPAPAQTRDGLHWEHGSGWTVLAAPS